MELSTAQISFIAASYAVNLANASNGPVSIQWAGGDLKAMPGQKVPDILKAFDKGQVTQPPVDRIQLDQVRGVNSPQPKVWLTRPDPGYRGEDRMIPGFETTMGEDI